MTTRRRHSWGCRGAGDVCNKRAADAGRRPDPDDRTIFRASQPLSRVTVWENWEATPWSAPGTRRLCSTLVSAKPSVADHQAAGDAAAAQHRGGRASPEPIGNFVHTITFDNGRSLSRMRKIAYALEGRDLLRHAVLAHGRRG